MKHKPSKKLQREQEKALKFRRPEVGHVASTQGNLAMDTRSSPNPYEDKAPLPDLADVPSLQAKASKLSRLVLLRQGLQAKIKELSKQSRELDTTQIMPLLKRANVDRVRVEGYPVGISTSTSSRIDKAMLVEHGVDPETIELCTKRRTGKPYVRVGQRKGEDAEVDDEGGGEEE